MLHRLKSAVAKLSGLEETYPSATREIKSFAKQNYESKHGSGLNYDEITIIMPSLNRMKIMQRCINALFKNTTVPFKLIIVDNNSNQETKTFLKDLVIQKKNIEVIFERTNIGASAGRQRALSKVETEFVAFLDNDIMIMPGYFENLMDTIQHDLKIAGVQSKVIFPNKLIQINHPTFEIKSGWIYYNDSDQNKLFNDPTTLLQEECKWIPIGATIWRTNIFNTFKFNEQMNTSYEDNDLSYRISKKGFKFLNCPFSLCIHFHSSFTPSSMSDKDYVQGRYDLNSIRNSAKIFYRENKLVFCYGERSKYVKEYLKFENDSEYINFLNS